MWPLRNDRLGGRASFQIVLQPLELLVTEIAKAAGFEIDHIDKTDEVHAVGIKAVPARTLGATTIALAV